MFGKSSKNTLYAAVYERIIRKHSRSPLQLLSENHYFRRHKRVLYCKAPKLHNRGPAGVLLNNVLRHHQLNLHSCTKQRNCSQITKKTA